MTPFTILTMPGWGFRPHEIAQVTDWQVLHMYAEPFMSMVRQLLGGSDPGPPARIPDELPPFWDDLVLNLMKEEHLTRDEAENKAANLCHALADLKRVQDEEKLVSTTPHG